MMNPIFDPYLSSCDEDIPFVEESNYFKTKDSYMKKWQQRRRLIKQHHLHRINSLAIFRRCHLSFSEKSFSQSNKKSFLRFNNRAKTI
jgi:hypothetical protein